MLNNQGVKYNLSSAELDALFSALADPIRRGILERLKEGQATVSELALPYSVSMPAITRHLKVLEAAGLIERGRDAQRRPCSLNAARLQAVEAWLETYRQLWEDRFAAVDAELLRLQTKSAGQTQREIPTDRQARAATGRGVREDPRHPKENHPKKTPSRKGGAR